MVRRFCTVIWPFMAGFWLAWIVLENANALNAPKSFWTNGSWVAWALFMVPFWLRKRFRREYAD